MNTISPSYAKVVADLSQRLIGTLGWIDLGMSHHDCRQPIIINPYTVTLQFEI